MNTKTVSIRDISLGVYDGPHATPRPSENGKVFLGIENITPEGTLDLHKIRYIADDQFAQWTKRTTPREDDIVFSYEATLHRYAMIPRGFDGCLGRRMALIRPNTGTVVPRYLHYYLLGPAWRQQVDSNTIQGSTVNRIPLIKFPGFTVDLPPLAEQRKISSTLAQYDDLIEKNTRRIRVLEDMARSTYREWFVDLRYPNRDGKALSTSPLGDIPEGWAVRALETLQAPVPYAINGGPFGSKLGTKDYVSSGVPVIRGSNLTEGGRFIAESFVFVTDEKARELHPSIARPGDIVVTQRGTLGQVGRVPTNTGYEQFIVSQSQMKLTLDPSQIDSDYAYFVLSSPEATEKIKNLASSSGVPHINLTTLREFLVLVPPLALQRQFAAFARDSELMVEVLGRTNRALRATRDLLLPRLLSGQLDVSHLPDPDSLTLPASEDAWDRSPPPSSLSKTRSAPTSPPSVGE